jgi:ferredoxin
MKVKVDFELCEANAVCMEACPEVFQLSDKDELTVLIEEPGAALRKKVAAAVHACPRCAITVEN